MFDIGFWELCLIAVIALLVFGPEKLPSAARSAGLWIGKARRIISSVKQEIDRELKLQELQEVRDSIKQSDQGGLHEFIEETKTDLNKLKEPININPTKPTVDKPAAIEAPKKTEAG